MATFMRAAVTGASGGIGRAVSVALAKPGALLLLSGRNREELEKTARMCREAGAEADIRVFDVRDAEASEQWARDCAGQGAELLLVSSGVSAAAEAQGETTLPERTEDLRREMEVNATGAVCLANSFARAAIEEGRGVQIGLIASLAAMTGLPSSPGYSASKAALRIYGQSLRRLLASEGVGVTVILPGFVESAMSRRYLGGKPGLVSAEEAARKIVRALESNRAELIFPWYLGLGIRLLALVPECLQGMFLAPFRFSVAPDEETKQMRGGGSR